MYKTLIIFLLFQLTFIARAQYQTNTYNLGTDYYLNQFLQEIILTHSVEVSGYNHNVLSGFLSLRIGLCSVGDGIVRFKNFIYKPIK